MKTDLFNIISEILKHEGTATIVTEGKDGVHVTATWNSYIEFNFDSFIIPAGGLNKTENNIKNGSKITMLIGAKEVQGINSMGTGFRMNGAATFVYSGSVFDKVKSRFSWARAAMIFTIESSEQLL